MNGHDDEFGFGYDHICVPVDHPDGWEPLQIEEIWGILMKGLSCEKGSQCGWKE